MKLQSLLTQILAKPDPFQVRSSSVKVITQSKHVQIKLKHLESLADLVQKAINQNRLLDQSQFGQTSNTPQKVFIINSVNFCFWAKKNQPKWKVEYPKGNIQDGWNALVACFNQALNDQIPILDPHFLSTLTLVQTKQLFKSSNQTTIPLLERRHRFLKETALKLNRHFDGQASNLIKQSKHDAVNLVKLILKYFPGFKDTSTYHQNPVYFYKRAQICAYDLSMLNNINLTSIEKLTVFADYKLPQLLRSLKVILYSKALANQVDGYHLIPKNSPKEVEIRAATIIAGELLSILLKLPPYIIDNALWVLSQSTNNQKPYHRTLTTNY